MLSWRFVLATTGCFGLFAFGCAEPFNDFIAPSSAFAAPIAHAKEVKPPTDSARPITTISKDEQQPDSEPPPGIASPPKDRRITGPANLRSIRQNKWVAFGGTYFRFWGSARTGSQPKGVSTTPLGDKVFVTNVGFHDRKNVYRYDPATLKVKAIAKFPGNAIESLSSPDGRMLYVSNFYGKKILALDTTTLAVQRTFRVQNLPKAFFDITGPQIPLGRQLGAGLY